jgi:hypothetical protein
MYIVVYMASYRNVRGRELVKKNCPFKNKEEEKLEVERENIDRGSHSVMTRKV